jgi:hypothetical protein
VDDGLSWHTEEVRRGLPPNNINEYTFSKPVNLIDKKFYFVKAQVLLPEDQHPENNEINLLIKKNKSVQFTD